MAPSCSLTPAITEQALDPLQQALEDLQNPQPVKYSWERRGQPCLSEGDTESGYISEAGSLASDCAMALHRYQMASLRPGESARVDPVPLSAPSRVEYRELIGDILHLMMGLSSETFLFDRVS